MSNWETLNSEIVYETAWIKVRRDEVLNQNGKPLTYSVVELNHPSVFIVAVNSNGKIFLQRVYRYTVDKEMWEIPAGHSDGQDLLVAAKRELMEETGLESDDWTNLGTFYQAAGIGNIPFAAFLARNVRPGIGERDDEEPILESDFKTIAEIEQMIATGEFLDSPVITALYAAKIQGL